MKREKDRIVRLMSCDLTVPGDITSDLLDHNLAWLWLCFYDGGEQKHRVKPEQKMYDFGLDEDVPGDWLVWSEHSDKSISVIHDLRILQSLGVRGYFIINEVGTMTFEKWQLSDHFIHTHTREVTFEGDPDEVTRASDHFFHTHTREVTFEGDPDEVTRVPKEEKLWKEDAAQNNTS